MIHFAPSAIHQTLIYINGCYICTCNTHTHTLQAEAGEDDALDARGIPGWDKVDHLAKALKGLSITNSQARNIKELYDALLDYDKKKRSPSPQG